MKKFLLPVVAAALLTGCTTSSHVVTGNVRPAIVADGVKVYGQAPAGAEVIGVVNANSSGGFTPAQCNEICVARLKKEAAKLGANGIVIGGMNSDWFNGATVTAQAIFVQQ